MSFSILTGCIYCSRSSACSRTLKPVELPLIKPNPVKSVALEIFDEVRCGDISQVEMK